MGNSSMMDVVETHPHMFDVCTICNGIWLVSVYRWNGEIGIQNFGGICLLFVAPLLLCC